MSIKEGCDDINKHTFEAIRVGWILRCETTNKCACERTYRYSMGLKGYIRLDHREKIYKIYKHLVKDNRENCFNAEKEG